MVGCAGGSVRAGMVKSHKIEKLLAANRSEIAIRIFRAATSWVCARLRCVFAGRPARAAPLQGGRSLSDREGQRPVEAYLDIAGIVALAKKKESTRFIRLWILVRERGVCSRLRKSGIIFIGPNAGPSGDAWRQNGSRRLAISAGVLFARDRRSHKVRDRREKKTRRRLDIPSS